MSALPLPAPADMHNPSTASLQRAAHRPPGREPSARARAARRWTLEPDLDFGVLDEPPARHRHDFASVEPLPASGAEQNVGLMTGDATVVAGPYSGARRALLRILVTGVAIATALFLFFPAGVEADSAPHATTTYVVRSGDTLWSLAATRTPAGSDLRGTISEIKALNGLTDSMLLVGDQIVLPVSGP